MNSTEGMMDNLRVTQQFPVNNDRTMDEQIQSADPTVHSPEQWRCSGDKYTASIDLSNRCREFYNSRLAAANSIKARWSAGKGYYSSESDDTQSSSSSSSSSASSSPSSTWSRRSQRPKRSSLDEKMETLRTEMMSLMDQDLSLMKQLLTLNEAIEDLKTQRGYCSSWASVSDSRNFASDWSVSDTEMYESDSDLTRHKHSSADWSETDRVVSPSTSREENTPGTPSTLAEDDNAFFSDRISLSSLTQQINNMGLTHPHQHCSNTNSRLSDNSRSAVSSKSPSHADDTSHFQFSDNHRRNAQEKQSKDFESSSSTKYESNAPPGRTVVIHHERDQNSFDSGIHDLMAFEDERVEWTV